LQSRFYSEDISVGNLRYIKAAMLYSIRIQETELERESSAWPTAVVDVDGVRNYSPTLAGRLAASTSQPMDQLVEAILSVVRR
jgi:hypothetical protein